MNEAFARREQFLKFRQCPPEELTNKLYRLLSIIDRRVHYGFSISCNIAEAKAAYANKFSVTADDPYFVCITRIFIKVLMQQMRLRIRERVSFIIDDQIHQDLDAKEAWRRLKYDNFPAPSPRQAARIAGIRQIMGGIAYESDKEFKPLQAADLLAWVTMRTEYENLALADSNADGESSVLQFMPLFHERLTIPLYAHHMTADEMLASAQFAAAYTHGVARMSGREPPPYENTKARTKRRQASPFSDRFLGPRLPDAEDS